MRLMEFTMILLVISCTGLVCSLIWMSLSAYKYFGLKQKKLAKDIEYAELESENKTGIIEYSERLLGMVRMVVGQICVLKFRTFKDTHDMTKVTKTQIEALVKDVAETANKSLNSDSIQFEITSFTREFYESYVVETSIILMKDQLDREVSRVVEEAE